MSAKQSGLVWELDLPHNEAWVLMAMADHADHDGRNVYPGVPLLAWKTGYTTRQVRRILAILQEKGLIVVEQPGGGRRTTRYRLELAHAARKDPNRPNEAPRRRPEERPDARGDIMSPHLSPGLETSISPLGGQNVRGALTVLCHPNHQGRKQIESSEPPPPNPPPADPRATQRTPPAGERGRELIQRSMMKDEKRGIDPALGSEMRAACTAWAARENLQSSRMDLFRRHAERLASWEDEDAWTHPQNSSVVPPDDRLRVLRLGLAHLADGTSHTLRGGVMYAVAKHYRIPPPIPGTEHAGVEARERAVQSPGPDRLHRAGAAAAIAIGAIIGGEEPSQGIESDPVERWGLEHPDDCATLRESIARQLAADVAGRRISERMVQAIGRTQYRQLVLQRMRTGCNGD